MVKDLGRRPHLVLGAALVVVVGNVDAAQNDRPFVCVAQEATIGMVAGGERS